VFTHFTSGLERRKHVALPQLSRVREYLVDSERSERIYLVTGVQVLSSPQIKTTLGWFFCGLEVSALRHLRQDLNGGPL